MSPITSEEPLARLDAVPGLYGINHGPITRQEIVIVDPIDENVIATFDKETALALAKRLQELAEQIEPGTTGWDTRDGNGWTRIPDTAHGLLRYIDEEAEHE